jgi:hypothetical protein
MTEAQAKKLLRRMLRSFTPGSILHLLAAVYRESAERAGPDVELAVRRRHRRVATALFVVGLGVDAACPR